jgi:hypothetical protein
MAYQLIGITDSKIRFSFLMMNYGVKQAKKNFPGGFGFAQSNLTP